MVATAHLSTITAWGRGGQGPVANRLPVMALAIESRVRATPTLGEFHCQNSYFPTMTKNCSVAEWLDLVICELVPSPWAL